MKIRIKKTNLIYSVWLFLILAFDFNIFYLYRSSDKLLGIQVKDITFLLSMAFIIWVVAIYFKKIFKNKYRYGVIFLWAIVMGIIGSVQALKFYHQPLMMGIQAHRLWLSSLAMYFPLTFLIQNGYYSYSSLKKTVWYFAILLYALCTLQYLFSGMQILKVSSNYDYGSIKFYYDESLMVLLAIILIAFIYRKHKYEIHKLFYVLWTFIFLFQITKYRSVLIALVLSTGIIIFFSRGNIIKKITLVMVILILGYLFLHSGSQLSESIINAINGQDASFNVRENGRLFYFEQLKNHWFFGKGYININWRNAYVMGGASKGFYYNDNGIIGILFYYGIFGVLWYGYINIKCFLDSFKIKKIYIKDFVRIFLLMNIIAGYTGLPNCLDDTIVFTIFLVILEYHRGKDKVKSKE